MTITITKIINTWNQNMDHNKINNNSNNNGSNKNIIIIVIKIMGGEQIK